MTRRELEAVVARVIHNHRGLTARELAYMILNKVEAPIRADEQEKHPHPEEVRTEERTKLHAQMLELPQHWDLDEDRAVPLYIRAVRLRDVLAVLK